MIQRSKVYEYGKFNRMKVKEKSKVEIIKF